MDLSRRTCPNPAAHAPMPPTCLNLLLEWRRCICYWLFIFLVLRVHILSVLHFSGLCSFLVSAFVEGSTGVRCGFWDETGQHRKTLSLGSMYFQSEGWAPPRAPSRDWNSNCMPRCFLFTPPGQTRSPLRTLCILDGWLGKCQGIRCSGLFRCMMRRKNLGVTRYQGLSMARLARGFHGI